MGFSVEQLTAMVEAALRKAKELWKQNPALIDQNRYTVTSGLAQLLDDEYIAEDGDE